MCQEGPTEEGGERDEWMGVLLCPVYCYHGGNHSYMYVCVLSTTTTPTTTTTTTTTLRTLTTNAH